MSEPTVNAHACTDRLSASAPAPVWTRTAARSVPKCPSMSVRTGSGRPVPPSWKACGAWSTPHRATGFVPPARLSTFTCATRPPSTARWNATSVSNWPSRTAARSQRSRRPPWTVPSTASSSRHGRRSSTSRPSCATADGTAGPLPLRRAIVESVGLPRGWYAGVAVTAALVLVAVLLLLPPPHRTRSAAPPGLPTLQSVWPAARPFPIPAVLDDGSRYHPKRILDPATSLGTADSADGRQVSLVLVSAGRSRVLQSEPVDRAGLFQGLLGTRDRLFWMLTATDAAGRPTVGLWSAARSGAAPALLTADVGLPLMLGSSYDLQLVAA